MSNVESQPQELTCQPGVGVESTVQVLSGRDVPLGGPRAMHVRRTLPHRQRSFVGAWCFVDHYGPNDVAQTNGMDVPPHPHTGLQTVSWLFEGEIEHRDSAGVHGMVRPGEVNLMTGGLGICHSEVSTAATSTLHGVQLWIALPDAHREAGRDFVHYAAPEFTFPQADTVRGSASGRVFIGSLAEQSSPVETFTPLLGAEVRLEADSQLRLDVDPSFEHAVLVDSGHVRLDSTDLKPADLGCRDAGSSTMHISSSVDEPARIIVLGGTPFDEEIIMWWNFVGRSHAEIVRFREEWEQGSERFGAVNGYQGSIERLPAPQLPGGTLKKRNRRGRI